MKILIADFDIFSKLGGGQTFYRRIIETNPDVSFAYLIDTEKSNNQRPKNTQVFSYQQTYIKADFKNISSKILNELYKWQKLDNIYRPFLLASNIAFSVKGQNFDIIECPDYEQYGMFLRPALEYFGVKFDKIVLSLHGKISRSLQLDWYVDQNDVKALDFCEHKEYLTADIRYGISKDYIEEWENLINIKSYYLNPLHFLELLQLNQVNNHNQNQQLPSLNFIGRKEKCKGADIFINLVSKIPSNLYSSANIFGPNSNLKNGKTAEDYLQSMLNLSSTKINLYGAIDKQKIQEIFASKSVTFLPSYADTLNLVALESLFLGCPTVIGNGAGVCRFLQDNFPQIPFIQVDVNNIYNCIPEIINLLENYDNYRQNLQQSLANIEIKIDGLTLTDIYNQPAEFNQETRQELAYYYHQLINHCQSQQFLGKQTLIKLAKTLIQLATNLSKKFG
jgi:glycosyltransferase involved in cell wall biosynthesis